MAKGQKSSASSATRKKHAKKAAGGEQLLPLPKEKKDKSGKKGKGKHAEPRQKIFIPPSKPAPVRPDPLTNSAIASKLPPELLVVLKRIAKKDPTTRQKALEELNTNWLARITSDSEIALTVALPVWLHHAPTLFLSAARRTRLLATQSHFLWLKKEGPRSRLVQLLRGGAPPSQVSAMTGAWRMTAEENDRAIAISARRSWDLVFCKPPIQDDDLDLGLNIPLDSEVLDPLIEFVQRVLLSPADVHSELNPVQPSIEPILPPHAARSKGQGGSRQPIRPAKPIKDEDDSSSHITEEDEELVDERNGRLRAGALGVLRWLLELNNPESLKQLDGLLSSPFFWTGLYHGPSPPFCHISEGLSSPLGKDQPVVRRATWAILTTLLNCLNGVIDASLLSIIAPAALRSAWVEPDSNVRNEMWEPLLRLLTKHSRAWEIDKSAGTGETPHDDHDDEGSDSESDEAEDETVRDNQDTLPTIQDAYHEFLQFLQLGCYGSPVQGYPAVVIVLSTLPPTILGLYPTWPNFLTSFWAALDGRALNQASDATLFLKSLLECIVLLVQRARAPPNQEIGVDVEGDEAYTESSLVSSQAKRVWEEVAKGRLGSAEAAGTAFSRFLMSIHNIDSSLWETTWLQISDIMKTNCLHSNEQKDWDLKLSRQFSLLSSIHAQAIANPNSSFSEKLLQATESLLRDIALSYVDEIRQAESASDVTKRAAIQLGKILETSSSSIMKDTNFTKLLDDLLLSHVDGKLDIVLCTSYIVNRGDPQKCRVVWDAMLKTLSADVGLLENSLPKLLDAAESGLLPSFLRRDDNETVSPFESVISSQLDRILEGRDQNVGIVRRLLQTPDAFISHRTLVKFVHKILETFSANARQSMFITRSSTGSEVAESTHPLNSEEEPIIRKLRVTLSLISSLIRTRPESLQNADLYPMFSWFFGVGYLLPASGMNNIDDCSAQARAIWKTSLEILGNSSLMPLAHSLCRNLISDVNSRIPSDAVLHALTDGHLPAKLDNAITELFPSRDMLDKILLSLPSDPLDSSLAVIDPLVPLISSNPLQPETASQVYDSQGYSSYSRITVSILKLILDERSMLRSNLWLLRHFMIISLAASNRRMVRRAKSAYFAQNASEELLLYVENNVKMLTSFVLAEYEGDSNWHSHLVEAFTTGKTQKTDLNGVAAFVSLVLDAALEEDTFRDCRVLFVTLEHVFNDAEVGDAEKWVLLSRKLEKRNPNTASSIILAISKSGLEPPSLDRLRNELAAGSLGIRSSKACTDGLALLRRLSASAPNIDSVVAFLPQNRAVNFVKACQSWLLAEEDEDDEDEEPGLELELEMTQIFQHLAPVLQLVPGAHWELFFDLVEENLENCSFDDSSSLPLLFRTLEFIGVLRELSVSNRALREDWSPRERTMISRVKQLVTEASVFSTVPADVPLNICWEYALGILQDVPKSLIDHETLSQMVHLLRYPSHDAAILSYMILRRAATALTEHLVIEAGVETSDETMKFEFPSQLLDVLKASLEPGTSEPNIVAYLLGWMIAFDLFEDASLRLKMGYGNHLRDLDLINSSFLPVVLELLDIGGGAKPFRLELWSIEQFYLECYETDLPLSVHLLAAHVLYRAVLHVPSLMSTWWTNCRDRQLSAAFRTVITRHYSPLLINSEFTHLRESGLSGDEWTIRMAPITGEVVVSFAVDEQALEICVDIPTDYPLHPVKVREIRKLGVEDKKWRAWLLAVQQVITSQNGRVADGISLFKKNVTSHFEDQTECAICYSILSVTELSLPKKRCKTCKNRFHASCLYKWFNTSHTSSCPLCRSDFI